MDGLGLRIQFRLGDAVVFQLAYQRLQREYHMRADIAADKETHDVTPRLQLPRVKQDPQIVDAL